MRNEEFNIGRGKAGITTGSALQQLYLSLVMYILAIILRNDNGAWIQFR